VSQHPPEELFHLPSIKPGKVRGGPGGLVAQTGNEETPGILGRGRFVYHDTLAELQDEFELAG
jgi:hypothetical protein